MFQASGYGSPRGLRSLGFEASDYIGPSGLRSRGFEASGEFDGYEAGERQCVQDPVVTCKELIGKFEASKTFKGPKRGYAFKQGMKGMGYYEDTSALEQEARSRVAAEAGNQAFQASGYGSPRGLRSPGFEASASDYVGPRGLRSPGFEASGEFDGYDQRQWSHSFSARHLRSPPNLYNRFYAPESVLSKTAVAFLEPLLNHHFIDNHLRRPVHVYYYYYYYYVFLLL